jgi:hypothetical protein
LELHGYRVERSSRDGEARTVVDTCLWHLLSHNLVLLRHGGTPGAVALHETGGAVRANGGVEADIVGEHLDGILQDWPLKPQLEINAIIHTLSVHGSDGAPVDLTIEIEDCLVQSSRREAEPACIVTIRCPARLDGLARVLFKHLCAQGADPETWPMARLVGRAAAADGWNDTESALLRRGEWSNLLRPLVRSMEAMRDPESTQAVHETRILIRHVQTMLDISRRLETRPLRRPKEDQLRGLETSLDALRQLDVLINFLETGRASETTTWVGIPGILETAPGLDGHAFVELVHGLQAWRLDEHARLMRENRYLKRPVAVHDLSIRWPPLPVFTKRSKEQRERIGEMLDAALKKLVREIQDLPPRPDTTQWRELRRCCRTIHQLLDTFPALKKSSEVRFLRHMVRLWLKRLGELLDVLASVELLAGLPARRPGAELAGPVKVLAESMGSWVDSVLLQIGSTLPALHLAARNARKTL